MTPWQKARQYLHLDEPKIVTVAVRIGTRILTGQRRDNNKWTFPGGHLDPGETLSEGAARELKEEAGIEIDLNDLELIAVERIAQGRNGKPFIVFAFDYSLKDGQIPTTYQDPDREVYQWRFVELKSTTPELHPESRHAQNDLILQHFNCWPDPNMIAKMTFRQKRMAYTSDEYTEGYMPKVDPLPPIQEEQAIVNIGKSKS